MPAHKTWMFNPVALHERIWVPGGSARKVARAYGCSHQTILFAQEEYGIPKRPEHGRLNGRWSTEYEHCREHGGRDVPHKAWGLCRNCYARLIHNPRAAKRRKARRCALNL